eukprot:m.130093 g.130093  ORF g.130093 m.130093 type:complete len:255 (-) comp29457_c1_seq1:93-857(-)
MADDDDEVFGFAADVLLDAEREHRAKKIEQESKKEQDASAQKQIDRAQTRRNKSQQFEDRLKLTKLKQEEVLRRQKERKMMLANEAVQNDDNMINTRSGTLGGMKTSPAVAWELTQAQAQTRSTSTTTNNNYKYYQSKPHAFENVFNRSPKTKRWDLPATTNMGDESEGIETDPSYAIPPAQGSPSPLKRMEQRQSSSSPSPSHRRKNETAASPSSLFDDPVHSKAAAWIQSFRQEIPFEERLKQDLQKKKHQY